MNGGRSPTTPSACFAGALTLDGERVLFWQDETGSEAGQWYAEPFSGGDAEPFLPGVAHGLEPGPLAGARASWPRASVTPTDSPCSSRSTVSRRRRSVAAPSRSRWAVPNVGLSDVGGLSADGSLLALEHAEHGDNLHPALRVVDPRTGSVVAEQIDDGMALLCRVLVARSRRSAARRDPRARGRGASRDLERGDGRLDSTSIWVSKVRSRSSTGGPTPRRCSSCTTTRDGTGSTDTTSRSATRTPIEHDAGIDQRGSRASRRRRVVPALERRSAPDVARPRRARSCCLRRVTPRPLAGRSSRGTSTTARATGCMAST